MRYDALIVGGGLAGLSAAVQLGRYNHKVLVIDSEDGRSSFCLRYHNLIGWPDGVSGPELRKAGRIQAEKVGVHFVHDKVIEASALNGEGFSVHTEAGETYEGRRLLLATGVMDRLPPLEGLRPCLGISIYVCPDCDGYELTGRRAIVMGSGNPGAHMADILSYWTNELVYINHENAEVKPELLAKLEEKGVRIVAERIERLVAEGDQLQGVTLATGEWVEGGRAFVAFGGNEVRSGLGAQLGVKLHGNRHIEADPRTKMTNVKHVWAAGDVLAHSEQASIAMGDGSQAAIWMHKSLIEKPGSPALRPLQDAVRHAQQEGI
ncbi:NAD(P)/FAD-dependent oxidoreductase [Paenibacillus herberti]|uniref:Pyridine nucleotide-disulfide oxidoreductase n=1 Tax=Paenibacillus herberti TaxID=1619309 RepID=A0A229NUG0_9BACL|nr:NAD(P)/FAD-dependent oxidoreductase [Paenibacillus herberti]OXM13511.1 pyridine nucleotide-disulfide oxidoreductase [Paenibacillus herberti]